MKEISQTIKVHICTVYREIHRNRGFTIITFGRLRGKPTTYQRLYRTLKSEEQLDITPRFWKDT